MLVNLLRERGVQVGTPVTGIVSYGVRVASELPTLNGNAGRLNKYEELVRLRERGILVPDHYRTILTAERVNYIGRTFHHTKGRDIKTFRNPQWGQSDYFVRLIPKRREYRVWAFRGRVKAIYEKILTYRNRNRTARLPNIIWNYRAGYAFTFVHPENHPEGLGKLGADAVAALDLDFGAVDIIQGTDGRFYVLEVNTAPGAEGPRQGISAIANSVQRWVVSGYPRRNGDVNQDQDRRRRIW